MQEKPTTYYCVELDCPLELSHIINYPGETVVFLSLPGVDTEKEWLRQQVTELQQAVTEFAERIRSDYALD